MTPTRERSIGGMRKHSRMQVMLVTPATLPQTLTTFCLPPLHPAYNLMSTTHRSDYLRVFLMYHVGGAYSDIKPSTTNWREQLDRLNRDPSKSFLGQRVKGGSVVTTKLPEARRSRAVWERLTTLGAFIAKPRCPFFEKMLSKVNAILTAKLPRLQRFPGSFARNVKFVTGDKGYPLGWHEILGDVGHELQQTDEFKSLAIVLPSATFIREGMDCAEYRGVEGDNIAGAWCALARDKEGCVAELRMFNCRVIGSWCAATTTDWESVARLAKTLLSMEKQKSGHTLGVCFGDMLAAEMLAQADKLKSDLRGSGLAVSAGGAMLVVNMKQRMKLLTILCRVLHEYKTTKEQFTCEKLVKQI